MLFQLFLGPGAVQQERTAVNQLLYHIVLADIGRIMASHKVCAVNQVGRLNRLLSETQMGHGDTAGLLGIIIKISLRVHVCVIADNLDGVLVRSDRTIRAKSPELAVDGSFRCGNKIRTCGQRKICHIINDADGEMSFLGIVIDCNDLVRGSVPGTQAVASAEDLNIFEFAVLQGFYNIQIQRLAVSSRLLGSVQNRNLLYCVRNSLDQMFRGERSVQTYLYNTDLAPLRVQIVDGLLDGVVDRAHCHNHMLCVRCSVIIEQLIVCADLCVNLVHISLNNIRKSVIELIAGLACGKEDIRVLRGSLFLRMLRIQRVCPECLQGIHIQHVTEILVIPGLDLLQLMRGTESVEEVDKRNLACQGRSMSNRGQVHHFLNGGLAQHGSAGLAACVYVRVITEDVQCVGSNAAGRDIEYCGQLLAGDFINVRDHQKKTLGSCVGSGQGAGCQRAVYSTCGTSLRLHFRNLNLLAEQVLSALGGPLVCVLRHRG